MKENYNILFWLPVIQILGIIVMMVYGMLLHVTKCLRFLNPGGGNCLQANTQVLN